MEHPKVDELIDFVFYPEKLSTEATKEIEEHISACIVCKAIILRYQEHKNG